MFLHRFLSGVDKFLAAEDEIALLLFLVSIVFLFLRLKNILLNNL